MSSNASRDDNLPSVSNNQEEQCNQDTRNSRDFSDEHDVSNFQNSETVNDTQNKRPRTEGQLDFDLQEPQVKRTKTSLEETQTNTDNRLASQIIADSSSSSSINADLSQPLAGDNNRPRSPTRTISRPPSSVETISRPDSPIVNDDSSSSTITSDNLAQPSAGNNNRPRSPTRTISRPPSSIGTVCRPPSQITVNSFLDDSSIKDLINKMKKENTEEYFTHKYIIGDFKAEGGNGKIFSCK